MIYVEKVSEMGIMLEMFVLTKEHCLSHTVWRCNHWLPRSSDISPFEFYLRSKYNL